MKAGTLHIWKKLTGIVMIAVMLILMVNNMAYIHVHVLPDGSLLTHAHPFSKKSESGQGSSHQHSAQSIQFFQNLQVLFLLGIVTLSILKPLTRWIRVFIFTPAFIPAFIPALPGRAPPVMD